MPSEFPRLWPDEIVPLTRQLEMLEKANPGSRAWQVARRAAATLLGEWHLPVNLAAASLMAPILVTTPEQRETLAGQFGDSVVQLAEELVRLRGSIPDREPPRASPEELSARLRALFDRTHHSQDGYLPLLLMADHHARLFDGKKTSPSRALAEESEAVFIPLAKVLGMWHVRRRWIQRVAPVLMPKACRRVQERLGSRPTWMDSQANQLYRQLVTAFHKDKMDVIVRRRPHLIGPAAWRIEKQLSQRGKPTFRLTLLIFCRTEDDCYRALATFPKVRGRWIRYNDGDYLTKGHDNGYRSLHYCFEQGDLVVEARVLTPEMHFLNEWGLPAFIRHPDRYRHVQAWWNPTHGRARIDEEPSGNTDTIEVFSPRGLRQNLEAGSTPLDYGYAIHAELGHRTVKAEVNGQSVPLNYRLSPGDVVTIYKDTYSNPDLSWLSIAVTRRARSRIRNKLVEQANSVHRGRGLIVERVTKLIEGYHRDKHYSFSVSTLALDDLLLEVVHSFGLADLYSLYEEVIIGHIKVEMILQWLVRRQFAFAVTGEDGRLEFAPRNLVFCENCRPVPGESLVAFERRRTRVLKELIIHTADCPGVTNQHRRIPIRWADQIPGADRVLVEYHIDAQDRPELLRDLLKVVHDQPGIMVRRVSARALEGEAAEIEVFSEVDRRTVPTLLQALERVRGTRRAVFRYATHSETLSLTPRRRFDRREPFGEFAIHDRLTFYDRAEQISGMLHWLNDPSPRNPLVVRGERRTGKTSLLHYLSDVVLADHGRIFPVFVDLHLLADWSMETLAMHLIGPIYQALGQPVPPPKAGMGTVDWMVDALNRAILLLSPQRLLLVIDEFSVLKDKEQAGLFDPYNLENLRTVIDTCRGMYWIVTVLNDHFFVWRSAERLFQEGLIMRVSHLEEHWARKFIVESMEVYGLSLAPGVADRIIQLTAGNPYLIKALCQEFLNQVAPSASSGTMEDLNMAVFNVLGDANTYLHHYVSDLSALDKNLLAAIAPYAEGRELPQIMAQLEELCPTYTADMIKGALDGMVRKGLLLINEVRGVRRVRFAVELARLWAKARPR